VKYLCFRCTIETTGSDEEPFHILINLLIVLMIQEKLNFFNGREMHSLQNKNYHSNN
jgi:hypothetical protein